MSYGRAVSAAAKAGCARRILRSAAIALLLSADRLERRQVLDQQNADARRPAELVRTGTR